MDTDKKLKVITWLLTITLVLTVFNSFGTIQTLRSLNGDIVASGQPATKRPSDYKFGKDYHKSLKSNKPMIVLFYADWCHYCINFMPTYQALYKKFRHKYNFVKINVEDSKYRKEIEKYQIVGFPTVFLVNPKKDTHIQLQNRDFGDMDKLENELKEFYKENKTK